MINLKYVSSCFGDLVVYSAVFCLGFETISWNNNNNMENSKKKQPTGIFFVLILSFISSLQILVWVKRELVRMNEIYILSWYEWTPFL